MRKVAALVALIAVVSIPINGEEPKAVAVKAARLLDVKSGSYVSNPVVVVRGDRVDSVGGRVPAGAEVIDLGDRTILPGLIDAHTHILLQGDATAPEYNEQILQEYPGHRVARTVRALRIALEHGFTVLRDLETEGASYDDVALRDAVNEGVIPGPRLKVVGRPSRRPGATRSPASAPTGCSRSESRSATARTPVDARCGSSSPMEPTGSRSTPIPAACA